MLKLPRKSVKLPRTFSLETRLTSLGSNMQRAVSGVFGEEGLLASPRPMAEVRTERIETELQRAANAANLSDNLAAVHHCHRTLHALEASLDALDEMEEAGFAGGGGPLARRRTTSTHEGRASSSAGKMRDSKRLKSWHTFDQPAAFEAPSTTS